MFFFIISGTTDQHHEPSAILWERHLQVQQLHSWSKEEDNCTGILSAPMSENGRNTWSKGTGSDCEFCCLIFRERTGQCHSHPQQSHCCRKFFLILSHFVFVKFMDDIYHVLCSIMNVFFYLAILFLLFNP